MCEIKTGRQWWRSDTTGRTMLLSKKIDRIELELHEAAVGGHAVLSVPDGWHDSSPIAKVTLSRDELRDLHYLIERMFDAMAMEASRLKR